MAHTTFKIFFRYVLLRDKVLYILSTLCIPLACFLCGALFENIWHFFFVSALCFVALEIAYGTFMANIYYDVCLRLSKFEKNAVSQEEKDEIRSALKGVSSIKLMFMVNPRNWTDDDIEEACRNQYWLSKMFLTNRTRERLFYLRYWYRNNVDENNFDDLGVAVLRAAKLHPSVFERIIGNAEFFGWVCKAIIFIALLSLNPLDYSFLP
jgi:hypothetical protein